MDDCNKLNVSFVVDLKKYPNIEYNETELSFICTQLFDKWYKIEYDKIFSLNDLDQKIQKGLDPIIHDLFGLSIGIKKGTVFENIMDKVLQSFPTYTYIKTSEINHSGDGILKFDNFDCMVEFKNYTSTVPRSQIDKLKSDMIEQNIFYSLMISTTHIQGKKDIDVENFNIQGKKFTIIYISNYYKNEMKIHIGIILIDQIYNLKKNLNYTFFHSQIKDLLSLIDGVHNLKTKFCKFEQDIRANLDTYYTNIREYENNVKIKINNIINHTNTVLTDNFNKSSIVLNSIDNDLLYKLYDEVFSSELMYLSLLNDQVIVYSYLDLIVCNIKILKKSLTIEFINPKYTLKISHSDFFLSKKLVKILIEKYIIDKKIEK